MSRALAALLSFLVVLLSVRTARADAEPPAKPTVYLALESPLAGNLEAVKAALKTALARMPKSWSLSMVNGCKGSEGRYEVSLPRTASEESEILESVTRGAGCTATSSGILYAAVSNWSGSPSLRHHLVLVTSSAPTSVRLGYAMDSATRQGFTVSFVALGNAATAERKLLQKRGAGHVYHVAPGAKLVAALRAELAWSRLSKGQQQALAAAVKEQDKRRAGLLKALKRNDAGMLKVLGSVGTGSGTVFGGRGDLRVGTGGGGIIGTIRGGGGGLGLGGLGGGSYTPKNPKLRRAESLLGNKLALSFRAVSCSRDCDLADARQQLLAAARPLLQCLEAALTLSGRDEVTARFAGGKAAGSRAAANGCLQSWLGKGGRGLHGDAGTLIVGPVSAVE